LFDKFLNPYLNPSLAPTLQRRVWEDEPEPPPSKQPKQFFCEECKTFLNLEEMKVHIKEQKHYIIQPTNTNTGATVDEVMDTNDTNTGDINANSQQSAISTFSLETIPVGQKGSSSAVKEMVFFFNCPNKALTTVMYQYTVV
jgi:hypothetical protein